VLSQEGAPGTLWLRGIRRTLQSIGGNWKYGASTERHGNELTIPATIAYGDRVARRLRLFKSQGGGEFMSNDSLPIRILVVDANQLIRVGIATLLLPESDMKLVGEASNGREAIAKFRESIGRHADGPADAGDEWLRCDCGHPRRISRSANHLC